jgi:hypothetical protein
VSSGSRGAAESAVAARVEARGAAIVGRGRGAGGAATLGDGACADTLAEATGAVTLTLGRGAGGSIDAAAGADAVGIGTIVVAATDAEPSAPVAPSTS